MSRCSRSPRHELHPASLPVARWTACLAVASAALLASCRSQPIDPTANRPVRPSEVRGCDEKGPDAIPPASTMPVGEERAQHRATRIAISQLSRIERDAGMRAVVDVRLDTVDGAGEPAVIAGDLRIVLRTSQADPCQLAFDVPMISRNQVAQRFDATLDQYVLRLEPEWRTEPARGTELELVATLMTVDGRLLESTARFAW